MAAEKVDHLISFSRADFFFFFFLQFRQIFFELSVLTKIKHKNVALKTWIYFKEWSDLRAFAGEVESN